MLQIRSRHGFSTQGFDLLLDTLESRQIATEQHQCLDFAGQ
jgi:hypothetical protein